MMHHVELDTIPSTNSWLTANSAGYPSMTMVTAREQTAGRGQRGNGWASAPGLNLTLSVLFRPENILPAQQFVISQATALAIVATLNEWNIGAKVKWPNDIYVGERKICGILIENSLTGMRLDHSVIGIGLNVNQTCFPPTVPNPVSMATLTGKEIPLPGVMTVMAESLETFLRLADSATGPERIRAEYRERLWRGDGRQYMFRDTSTSETFRARIEDIDPAGPMLLIDDKGETRRYWFKEVAFLPGKEASAENIGKYGGGF